MRPPHLQRLDVRIKPIEDHGKTEPAFSDSADHEDVGLLWIRFDREAVHQQERVTGIECDALVAVEEGVIVRERFHQARGFFCQTGVIASLRAEDGGLQGPHISHAMGTAVAFDLSMVNGQDFGYREVGTRGHFYLLRASFSYNFRYCLLERREASSTSGRTSR
jgi:hypothetical protein